MPKWIIGNLRKKMKKPHSKKYEVTIIVEAKDKQEVKDLFPMFKLQIKQIMAKRSLDQNSAMHLWFTQLEEECKSNGITMDMVITKPQEIPVTRHILKDLFRFVGKKMFGIKSTADLDKLQFYDVQKTFEKTLGQNCELYIPFPSEEQLYD